MGCFYAHRRCVWETLGGYDETMRRGQTVDLLGTAFNTNAIASFIENLDKVPEFREPDTRDVRLSGGGTYAYRISFRFDQRAQLAKEPAPPEASAAAPEAAGAAAAP